MLKPHDSVSLGFGLTLSAERNGVPLQLLYDAPLGDVVYVTMNRGRRIDFTLTRGFSSFRVVDSRTGTRITDEKHVDEPIYFELRREQEGHPFEVTLADKSIKIILVSQNEFDRLRKNPSVPTVFLIHDGAL